MKAFKIFFTGGTIGSTLSDGVIRPETGKPRALLKAYEEKYGVSLSELADIEEPYTILSEYLDGTTLFRLIQAVARALDQGYQGIIITHGTDTLQYAGAALGYAFGLCSVPIVLVSSNYPIEDARANGVANLRGAVCWLGDCISGGVWVSYQNTGEPVKLHRATRLLPHVQGSDLLQSITDTAAGYYDSQWNFHQNSWYTEKKDEIAPLYPSAFLDAPEILWLKSYPGMIYPGLTKRIRGILYETYHSGTVNMQEAAPFFKKAQALEIPVYIIGTYAGAIYESAEEFGVYGLRLLPGRSGICVYMKLWLTLACGAEPKETLSPALGGDI